MKIEGVGEATAKKLFKRFKTVKAIKSATVEEILSAGISRKTAENILKFYND
jgi:excinuclease ABC subunit C